jgi:hypothetical protein
MGRGRRIERYRTGYDDESSTVLRYAVVRSVEHTVPDVGVSGPELCQDYPLEVATRAGRSREERGASRLVIREPSHVLHDKPPRLRFIDAAEHIRP